MHFDIAFDDAVQAGRGVANGVKRLGFLKSEHIAFGEQPILEGDWRFREPRHASNERVGLRPLHPRPQCEEMAGLRPRGFFTDCAAENNSKFFLR
jgi:hypothetical protein